MGMENNSPYNILVSLSDSIDIKCWHLLSKMRGLTVSNAGFDPVNGKYLSQPHTLVPESFDLVCRQQGWDTAQMWSKLNGQREWYKHQLNESYVYYNNADSKWWIDGPDGLGVYITSPAPFKPPSEQSWILIQKHVKSTDLPVVECNYN